MAKQDDFEKQRNNMSKESRITMVSDLMEN